MDTIHTEIIGKGKKMSFNANIPQPTDIPANSQPQLLANFQGINTLINVNHIGFDLADQGKHKWVSFPDQVLAVPTTLNTEVALFSSTNIDTGNIELNFVRQNNGTVIPMTARGGTTSGWTMLPSGIIIKWNTGAGFGSFPVNANAFGKAFTTIYSVQVCNAGTTYNTAYVYGSVATATTLNIVCMDRSTASTPIAANYSWLAVGV